MLVTRDPSIETACPVQSRTKSRLRPSRSGCSAASRATVETPAAMPIASGRASINASYDLCGMALDQLSLVDPRRLLVLDAVGRHGSFAGAARSLSLTPSAVSQQIAALERECGTQLLERSARSIRFTDAGQRLVARAASLRDLLEHAQTDLATLRGAERRGLSVGIFESAARGCLPAALKRFRSTHPRVTVKVRELEPEPALEVLRRG